MHRDERPVCVGYVRPCPTCQDEDEQRKQLGSWFWTHAVGQYRWGGYYQDKPKAPNEMMKRRRSRERHPCSYMWVRPGCEQMREQLQTGDLLIACRLGVLSNDITDALEGLPTFVDRPIRVVLTEDNVELRSEYFKLMRAQQRDWLMAPTKSTSKTPPLGMRRDSNKWSPAVKELRYMRWCYRRLVLSPDLSPEDILETAKETLIHPRTRKPPAHLSTLRHAADAYHDSLVMVQLGQELPRWVREAQKRGFFTERVDEIVAARVAGLDPFPDDEPRVPHRGYQAAGANGR